MPVCLIGESDPFVARLLRRFAEKVGVEVVLAQTGEDLLNLASTLAPDVIILDPDLPGKLRGRDMTQSLKTTPTPIMVCSWESETCIQATYGEYAYYLQKSDLHYDEFASALKHLVEV